MCSAAPKQAFLSTNKIRRTFLIVECVAVVHSYVHLGHVFIRFRLVYSILEILCSRDTFVRPSTIEMRYRTDAISHRRETVEADTQYYVPMLFYMQDITNNIIFLLFFTHRR